MRSGDEERILVEKAKKGDKDAFGELVRRYQNPLFCLARSLISSYDESLDITSEAFVRAWKYLRGFNGRSSFKTWLWRILINLSRTHLRRRYLANKIFFFTKYVNDETGRVRDIEWEDVSPSSKPEAVSEQKNIRQLVQRAKKTLSPRESEVFALKYDGNLKIAEIAEMLSISVNTVKVLLFRATKKMAVALKDYGK